MKILDILVLIKEQKLTPEQGLELITNGVQTMNELVEPKQEETKKWWQIGKKDEK